MLVDRQDRTDSSDFAGHVHTERHGLGFWEILWDSAKGHLLTAVIGTEDEELETLPL